MKFAKHSQFQELGQQDVMNTFALLVKLDPSGDSMEEIRRAYDEPQLLRPQQSQPTIGSAHNRASPRRALPLTHGKVEHVLKRLNAEMESVQVAKLKAQLARAEQDAAEAKQAARAAEAELLSSEY